MVKHFSTRLLRRAWLLFLTCLLLSTGALAATTPDKGDKLANDGNFAAAVKVFAEAHKQTPQDVQIISNLARVNLRLGEGKKAVAWAQQAVDLEPRRASHYMLLADAYSHYVNEVSMLRKLGIAHKIRDAYLKAVALEPDNSQARFSLASFYILAPGVAGGSDDKGEEQIRALEKFDPAMAAMARFRQAMQGKQYKQAEDWLRKAATSPGDEGGYQRLAAWLASRDRNDEAIAIYRKIIAEDPSAHGAYYQLGRQAAEGRVKPPEGIAAIQAYLGMSIDWHAGDPPFCWAHYRLGQILARAGEKQKAVAEYQQALKLKPDFEEAKQAMQKLATS